jgi:hypothetical protein
MLTYVLIVISSLIGHLLGRYRGWLYLILCTAMVAVAALRYDVGTDYLQYADMVGYGNNLPWIEPGYQLINYVFFLLELPGWSLLTFFSLVTLPLYFLFIHKYSVNPNLSLLLFVLIGFYFISFNAVRQIFAIIFLLFAFQLWNKERKQLAFFLILFSISFHYSVLIALPLYAIALKHWSRGTYVTLLVLATFLGFSGLAMHMPIFFIEGAADNPFLIRSPIAVLKVIAPTIFLVYLLYFDWKFIRSNFNQFNLFFIYVIFSIMFYGINYFIRINFYFEIWLILFLPSFLHKRTQFHRFLWSVMFIIYFIALFIGNFLILNGHSVLPYNTLFEVSI